jgi:hypothetical protein
MVEHCSGLFRLFSDQRYDVRQRIEQKMGFYLRLKHPELRFNQLPFRCHASQFLFPDTGGFGLFPHRNILSQVNDLDDFAFFIPDGESPDLYGSFPSGRVGAGMFAYSLRAGPYGLEKGALVTSAMIGTADDILP